MRPPRLPLLSLGLPLVLLPAGCDEPADEEPAHTDGHGEGGPETGHPYEHDKLATHPPPAGMPCGLWSAHTSDVEPTPTRYWYDGRGRLLVEDLLLEDGRRDDRTVFVYADAGDRHPTELVHVNPDDAIWLRTVRTWGPDGRLVSAERQEEPLDGVGGQVTHRVSYTWDGAHVLREETDEGDDPGSAGDGSPVFDGVPDRVRTWTRDPAAHTVTVEEDRTGNGVVDERVVMTHEETLDDLLDLVAWPLVAIPARIVRIEDDEDADGTPEATTVLEYDDELTAMVTTTADGTELIRVELRYVCED